MSKYQELCKALETARGNFSGYRSDCVFFAANFTRGFTEYTGWPRENLAYEAAYEGVAGPGEATITQKPEDAMHLDEDAYWHFGLRLVVAADAKTHDVIKLRVRFKKLETRYIISLFGFEDFEVPAPVTTDELHPVYDAILNAVRRHYDYGLRLFLENGGRGLKIPISAARLLGMARGVGGGSA